MFLQLCPVCEHRNPRGSRFCNECGSPLQLRFCPACHAAEDVMSLNCRSCGEKLPVVMVTDEELDPTDIPVNTENIWREDAPTPTFAKADDDVPVTVHGGDAPAPAFPNTAPAPAFEHTATETSSSVIDEIIAQVEHPREQSVQQAAPSVQAEPVAQADSVAHAKPMAETAPAQTRQAPTEPPRKKKSKKATLIERLHTEQPEVDPPSSKVVAPPETPVDETVAKESGLRQEAQSEIEIGAEAETLEASVGPITYVRPEELEPASARLDKLVSQLREGAWRSAMSVDPGSGTGRALAPAVFGASVPRARRLNMHRLAIALAVLGAVGAVAYSVSLAPGTGTAAPATEAAVPVVHPIGVPMRNVEKMAPAAGVAAAVPAGASVAKNMEPLATPPAPPAPVAEKATENPPGKVPEKAREKPPEQVAARAATPADPPAAAPKPAPIRRAAPAPAAETVTSPPLKPRPVAGPCTTAVAALGLCTLEAAPPQGN
jgi:hypothetical protein